MSQLVSEPLSLYNTTIVPAGARPSVRLREITLRQLGHMDSGLGFEEKLYLLSRLAEIGVKESVVWGIDPDAADLVRASRAAGIEIDIALFGKVYFRPEMLTILDKAQECGAALVSFVGRGPEGFLTDMGWSPAKMLEVSVECVKEAKERDLPIGIGLSYVTQTSPAFVEEFCGAVEAAGADRLHIPDSLGVASPDGMRKLVSTVRRIVSIPIEVHCHNDFGLAVACTIASIEAGASVVEVIVNGMDPERSGIASLDEVVMALELLYGLPTGIQTEQLWELSQLHQQMTNTAVAINKPIVGPRAFNYRVAPGRAGSKPQRDQFYSSPKVLPFDPKLVGNDRAFILGRFSGTNEVRKRADDLGLTCTEEEVELLSKLVMERGRSNNKAISDDDFRYLLDVARVRSPSS